MISDIVNTALKIERILNINQDLVVFEIDFQFFIGY